MITYLLEASICLALFYAIYIFFLEKEKMHQFNRFYLIGTLFLSFAIPNIILPLEHPVSTLGTSFTTATTSVLPISGIEVYLVIGYLMVAAIMLVRFAGNLYSILKKTRDLDVVEFKGATIVLSEENILPHTFFNYIFITKQEFENQEVDEQLFTHELTHVHQKHSLDIVVIELFQIVFWFNPLLVAIKKSIQLNHEYIADEMVISKHQDMPGYQHLLLSIAEGASENRLVSNINYAVAKKRFNMMMKKSSRQAKLVGMFLIVPAMIALVSLFADVSGHENDWDPEHTHTTLADHEEREDHGERHSEREQGEEIGHHNSEDHNEESEHEYH